MAVIKSGEAEFEVHPFVLAHTRLNWTHTASIEDRNQKHVFICVPFSNASYDFLYMVRLVQVAIN